MAIASTTRPTRTLTGLLAAVLCFGLTAPTASATPAPTTPHTSTAPAAPTTLENQQVQPAGIKGWLVSQALRGLAGGLRTSADEFIRLGGTWLDDGARAALRQHSGRIADVLDDIAKTPDLATHAAKEKAYNELSKFLDPGTAQVIADALEGILFILL